MKTIYNRILEKIILPAGDAYLGTSYMKNLNYWRSIQYKSKTELENIQREKLQALLNHAKANVPFYKNKSINLEQDPYQYIKNFPIMTKNVIKSNIDDLVLGDKEKLVKLVSSGSSGVQGEVYMEKTNQSMQQAVQTLWWEWSGYNIGDTLLQTGMTPERGIVKSAKDFLLRTKYVIAFNLDEKVVLNTLREIQKKPVDYFMGYASSLFVYAKVAEQNGIKDINFKAIVSWGDKMFPHFRLLLEKQFHSSVYDTYGCSEGFMIASECDQHNYHIMTPLVYLELLNDEGNEVKPGELGKVVVTRLDNYTMPLIRYYLGDLAIAKDPELKCTCGRSLPLLEKIIGRDTDIVKTRTGKYMIVHFFTGIFEHFPEIKQFRVVQNDLDSIEIEYIKDRNFEPSILDQITVKIQNYLEENFPVNYKEVDFIAPTPSGKPQIIKSFLKQL